MINFFNIQLFDKQQIKIENIARTFFCSNFENSITFSTLHSHFQHDVEHETKTQVKRFEKLKRVIFDRTS